MPLYIRLFDPCPWAVALVCEEHRVGLVFDMVGDPVAGIWQREIGPSSVVQYDACYFGHSRTLNVLDSKGTVVPLRWKCSC